MTLRLSAALLALSVSVAPTLAQTAARPAPAKKAAPAKRAPAPKKPVVQAPVEAPLPTASAEQLSAAELAYLGSYACEFNQTLSVAKHAQEAGYIDVVFDKHTYTMKPVLSSTGALRLEDVKDRTLMIQIANKSMLMDVKAGRRLVDECLNERQVAFRAAPPPNANPGLGIDPVRAAATAASAAADAASAAAAAADAAQQAATAAKAAAAAASATSAAPASPAAPASAPM